MKILNIPRKHLLALFAALLPFSILLSKMVLGLLTVLWLFNEVKYIKPRTLFSKPLIFYILFFCCHAFYLPFASDTQAWLTDIEKQAFILIIALVILTGRKIEKEEYRHVLKFFIVSNIVALLVCLVLALFNFLQTNDLNVFFYDKFSTLIGLHPLYFSLYLAFSLFILIHSENKLLPWPRVIRFLVAGFLIIGLILCSARIVILTTCLGLLLILIVRINLRRHALKISIYIICTGVVSFFLLKGSYLQNRFEALKNTDFLYILKSEKFPEYYTFDGDRRRVLNLKIFLDAVSDPKVLIFGKGNGNGQAYLKSQIEYYRSNYINYKGTYTNYNYHNQYMETAIDFGLLGLLLLLALYFNQLINIIRQKHILFLSFILLISVSSLTESILERSQGFLFFAFFSVLFFCQFHFDKKSSV